MKQLFTLLLLIPFLGLAQITVEQDLDSISTKKAAKSFIETNKSKKGKLVTFNKEKHKTRIANDLFKLSKGGKKVIKTDYKTTYYKIIDKSKKLHHRVSYIYLDGHKMTLEEINTARNNILSQYKEGYSFKSLAKLHSMDNGAKQGGDLGWFAEGVMHPEFEAAVKNHDVNDIFTLDISDRLWYYVVLKTFEPKPIEEITVLKITENHE